MRTIGRRIGAAAGLLLTGCEMAQSPARHAAATGGGTPAPRAAQDLWLSYCASCHGVSGQGTPVAMVSFGPAWQAARSDSAIRARIAYGVPGTTMAAWGRQLSADEVEVLVRYVRGVRGG